MQLLHYLLARVISWWFASGIFFLTEENAGEEEAELKTEGERESKKPCVGRFGSFVARFNDGLTLGISTYGNSGLPVDGESSSPSFI